VRPASRPSSSTMAGGVHGRRVGDDFDVGRAGEGEARAGDRAG
jgi:hypothetical protein